MNFSMRKVVQHNALAAMSGKKDLEEHLYFWTMPEMINTYMLNPSNKTWINENDIVEELPFPDGMLRKPIQMWFWAMTDKCIMYWKTDCF